MKPLLVKRLSIAFMFFITTTQSEFTFAQPTSQESQLKRSLVGFKKTRNPNKVLMSLDSVGDLGKIVSDSLRAAAYYYKGSALGQLSQFDSSIYFLNRSRELLEGKSHTELEVVSHMAFGNVYWAKQYISLALEFYQKGLDISVQQPEQAYRQLETQLLGNIAGVYAKMEDFEKALNFAQLANENLLKTDPNGKVPRNYLKLGSYLNALKRPAQAIDKLNIAEQQAVAIADSIALSHIQDAKAFSYFLLGNITQSERAAYLSLSIASSLRYKFASPYFTLASISLQRQQYKQAKELANKGSILADQLSDINEKKKAIDLIYQIALREKDYPTAIQNLRKTSELNDSIRSIARNKQVEEIQIRYETEKQQQQIKELEASNIVKDLEASNANQRQLFLGISLLLLLISIVVLYNRYQLKQRTSKVLDEKNKELQKLNGFKDRMFAVISHDLRNPVDAFNTIIESLNENLQHASQEELREFLGSTLNSAKDLRSLLNNLLEWSLIQIGKLPFDPKPVALGEVVADSVSHLESMATLKKIDLTSALDSEQVLGDRSMITIIVRNLVSNAIKFSEAGKSVQLRTFKENGSVVLSVTDKGVGMTPEELHKLFKQEEDVRSIGSSPAKGAGIGLLLCKELADKNGGKIYAESEEGKGSTFYLVLPSA